MPSYCLFGQLLLFSDILAVQDAGHVLLFSGILTVRDVSHVLLFSGILAVRDAHHSTAFLLDFSASLILLIMMF